MGWLDDLARAGPVAGGFLGGPESLAKFRAEMQANPVFSKYLPGLSDAELAPQAFNPNNVWEPINPSGQLRLNLGDYRFEVGEEGNIDWLNRMAQAQRAGPAEARRQLRAWEQNYDPTQFFHVSTQDFPAFDLGKASTGANAGWGQKERAAFLTDAPEIANTYANLGTPDRPWNTVNMWDSPRTYPLRVRDLDQFDVMDWGGNLYDRGEAWRHLERAKKEGRPGVVWENILDPGPYGHPGFPGAATAEEEFSNYPLSRVLGVFEPEKIRSAFAQFDPRKLHLNDLNAGIATTAIGGGALAAGMMGGSGEAEAAAAPAWLSGLQAAGKVPHVADKGPYKFGQYLRADKGQMGVPDERLVFPSGLLYWPSRQGLAGERQRQKLLEGIDAWEGGPLQREADKRGLPLFDYLARGFGDYTVDALRKAGFTGVGHGSFLDPAGATMIDPLHMRGGEAAWRQALADQQNYDPRQMYHSGTVPFSQIDLSYASSGTNKGVGGAGEKEKAFFLTPNPAQSASYLPRTREMLGWDPQALKWQGIDPDDPANAYLLQRQPAEYAQGAQTYPLRLRGTEDFWFHDMAGRGYSRNEVWPVLAEARAAGAPGVRFRDMRDEGPWETHLGGSYPSSGDPADVFAAFEPERIRSAWAEFDPAKKHLNDLGASVPPLLAGGGAAAAAGGAGLAGLAASGGEAEAAGLPAPPSPQTSNAAAKGDRAPLPQVSDLTLAGAWPTPGSEAAFPDRSTWLGRLADNYNTIREAATEPPDPWGPFQPRHLRQGADVLSTAAAFGKEAITAPPKALKRQADLMASGQWQNQRPTDWFWDMADILGASAGAGFARSAGARLPPGEAELGAMGSKRLALLGGGPKPGQMGPEAMREAEKRLYAAGRDPFELEAIRQETGYFLTPGSNRQNRWPEQDTFQGPDIRYEMSDAGTELRLPSAFGPAFGQQSQWSGQLGDIVQFPELYRQMPNLRTLPTTLYADPDPLSIAGAQYRYPPGYPHLPDEGATGRDLGEVTVWSAGQNEGTLEKLAHEAPGHAVDYYSGHPQGGAATDLGYFFKGGEVNAHDLATHRLWMDDIDKFHDWPALARAYAEGRAVDEPLPWFPRPAGIGPQGQVERMWAKPADPATIQARRQEAIKSGRMPWGKDLLGPENEANRLTRRALDRLINEGKPLPWEPGGSPLGSMVAHDWTTKGGQVRPGNKPGPKPGTMKLINAPGWVQRQVHQERMAEIARRQAAGEPLPWQGGEPFKDWMK